MVRSGKVWYGLSSIQLTIDDKKNCWFEVFVENQSMRRLFYAVQARLWDLAVALHTFWQIIHSSLVAYRVQTFASGCGWFIYVPPWFSNSPTVIEHSRTEILLTSFPCSGIEFNPLTTMSKSPQPPNRTHHVERSPLLDRLQAFLPQLKAANDQLEKVCINALVNSDMDCIYWEPAFCLFFSSFFLTPFSLGYCIQWCPKVQFWGYHRLWNPPSDSALYWCPGAPKGRTEKRCHCNSTIWPRETATSQSARHQDALAGQWRRPIRTTQRETNGPGSGWDQWRGAG